MRSVLLIIAVMVAWLVSVGEARAEMVVGRQGFFSPGVSAVPNNNIDDSHFFLPFVTKAGTEQGDFGSPASFVGALDFTDDSTLLSFVFGSLIYGVFVPTAILQNTHVPGTERIVAFSGTFTPGFDFQPGLEPNPNSTLTINIAPGIPNFTSTSTLVANVPEPSSIALFGTLVVPSLGLWMCRRASLAASRSGFKFVPLR